MRSIAIVTLMVGLLQSAAAYSAVIGSLVFVTPTGTVGATDTIDINVRLTLDASSDPLTYNPYDSYPNGVNDNDIPLEGHDDFGNPVVFAEYSYIGQFTGRSCNDTFTVGCSGAGSQYSYSVPTTNSWFDFDGTINAGESMDFTLYTLTPVAGGAAPGTYDLFTGYLGLEIIGEDEFGSELRADIYSFSTNCSDANCTFSRTVSAVPLPAAAWLFGSAMIGLFGIARRKKA
jgi:hypothetical protein